MWYVSGIRWMLLVLLMIQYASNYEDGTDVFYTSKMTTITKRTPCCEDRITTETCKTMQRNNVAYFNQACRTNADFSLIQCCSSCHYLPGSKTRRVLLYEKDVKRLLMDKNKAEITCVDRHSSAYCLQFQVGSNHRNNNVTMTCAQMPLAFRTCRKTCGYCSTRNKTAIVRYNGDKAMNPQLCLKT